MKPEYVLDAIKEAVAALNEDEAKFIDSCHKGRVLSAPGLGRLAELYYMAEKEICEKESHTSPSTLSALKRIMKRGTKTNRSFMQYGTTQNGVQYFCDGMCLVGLNQPLSAYENPDPTEVRCDYNCLIPKDALAWAQVSCPSLADLKAYQKLHKSDKKDGVKYDFGPDLAYVNIQYLIDMIEVLGEHDLRVNEWYVYMESDVGVGFMCGIRLGPDVVRQKTNLEMMK